MSQAIQFTKFHEDLLVGHSKGIRQNTEAIEQLRDEMRRQGVSLEETKGEVSRQGASLEETKGEVRRLGILMEDLKSTVNKILEVVTHTNKRFAQQDVMEDRLDDHDHRIAAIENRLKPS